MVSTHTYISFKTINSEIRILSFGVLTFLFLFLTAISQPLREFLCKIVEMSEFAVDFVLGHFILFFLSVFCLIPYINTAHSLMLFWLRPSKQIRPPIWTAKQVHTRKKIAITYGIMFLGMFLSFTGLLVAPLILGKGLKLVNTRKLPI
ncbi:hypothetical protein CLU79DRAFT_745806 [Phycomyces nitens]|nr:hypothetical protein CLU79DRAFT_745806 [Phycomyces nitens]